MTIRNRLTGSKRAWTRNTGLAVLDMLLAADYPPSRHTAQKAIGYALNEIWRLDTWPSFIEDAEYKSDPECHEETINILTNRGELHEINVST